MTRAKAILAVVAAAPFLSGCLVTDVAGAAIGATGAVVGGAVDLVTTSEEEQMRKDNKALKKENEELKRQQQQQPTN
jgi:hypothetical protein